MLDMAVLLSLAAVPMPAVPNAAGIIIVLHYGYNHTMRTCISSANTVRRGVHRPLFREYLLFGAPEGDPFPASDYALPLAIFAPDAVTGSLDITLPTGQRYNLRLFSRSMYGVVSDEYAELSVLYDGVSAGPKPTRISNLRAFQSGTSVVLTWTIDPEYGSAPDGFRVYRAEDLTTIIATVAYSSPKRTYRWTESPATSALYRYTVRSYRGTILDLNNTVVSVNFDRDGHAAPTGSITLTQES